MIARTMALGSLILPFAIGQVRADDPPTDPDAAMQQLFAAYFAQTALRPEWDRAKREAQTNTTLDILAFEDGQTILGTQAGTFVWNASIGNVELWTEGVQQTLTLFVDGACRVAFEGENMSGYVDTLDGDYLFFLLQLNGSASMWVFEVDGESNIMLPVEINPRKCLCAGSNNECPNPRIACAVALPCSFTRPGGGPLVNSTCQWLIPPLEQ